MIDDPTRPVPTTPIRSRWVFTRPGTDHAVEVDVIVATPEEWRERPESRSPLWGTLGLRDELVVAVSILF